MKTYNSPMTQIVDCKASYMVMQNVSGGGFAGIKDESQDNTIEIN